jgi:hypothetical protein
MIGTIYNWAQFEGPVTRIPATGCFPCHDFKNQAQYLEADPGIEKKPMLEDVSRRKSDQGKGYDL